MMVGKNFGHSIKIVRSEKGGEFTSGRMQRLCAQKGIKRKFANTCTPSENGVVECKNKTVVEVARMEHMGLLSKL